ncbi:unknown [Clostridium sp. CAG:306]|nr:unknown [Clostridium sp. CAG:306]
MSHKVILLILINILISSNILPAMIFTLLLIIGFADMSSIPISQEVGFYFLVCLWFFTMLLILICKICIFPYCYKNLSKNNFLFDYIEKIRLDKKFAIKILLSVIILDFCITYSYINIPCFSYMSLFNVFCFGGVFICYLSLIVWFKIKEKSSKNCG